MSSIITTIKIITFLFPFLKELFIGKGNSASKKAKISAFERITKLIAITLGCASIALNVHLTGKAYNLGRQNLTLQKQIKESTPESTLCPRIEQVTMPITPTLGPANKQKHPPMEKPVRAIAALPPERESYLKELESINKIR